MLEEFQTDIRENDELLTLVKMNTKVVWPRLKIFWFSKDDPTGGGKRIVKLKNGQEWTLPAQLEQLKT